MSRLLWFEQNPTATTFAVRNAAEGLSAFTVERVREFAELEGLFADHPPAAVVLDWDACTFPCWFVEQYWQNHQLGLVPLVVVTGRKMDPRNLAYLDEYTADAPIVVGPGLRKDALRNAIIGVTRVTDSPGKMKERVRRFFALLHGDHYDEAQQFLEGHLLTFCSATDALFYKAHVVKARKRFTEATALLGRGLKMLAQTEALEARFLHLLGNIAFRRQDYPGAVRFLVAAQRLSPHNLRRQLLLAQCLQEMGRRPAALALYRLIYKQCHSYPGVHVRLAELTCELASARSEIESLRGVIRAVQDRRLISLYKTVSETSPNASCVVALRDIVVSELSERANAQIRASDFYGAVKQYNHINKILPVIDTARRASLDYCYARVYYLAGDLAKAQVYIVDALLHAAGARERFEKLARVIDLAIAARKAA